MLWQGILVAIKYPSEALMQTYLFGTLREVEVTYNGP